MSESGESPKRNTLVQFVTRILVGEPKPPEPQVDVVPEKPAESDEKAGERLAAYQKFCEQEAQKAPAEGEVPKKKIKYQAADFNSGPRPGVKTN